MMSKLSVFSGKFNCSMTKVDKKIIKEFNNTRSHSMYLCHAPFTSIKVSMDGRVSPCCYNKSSDDYYFSKSLSEIWSGEIFNFYRNNIRHNILPQACITCEKSLWNKEYHSVKIHQYDKYKLSLLGKPKPRIIEMALSNNCNLECIMCSGRYSSSIRKNREKLPPLENLYGKKFREELRQYIPYLQEAVFAGGEPFLIPIYYDIWDDIIRLNPACEISIVTNGTVLNDKIKSFVERGNFKINLSFDSITKTNYESIRVNACFEDSLKNMEYYGSVMQKKGKRLHIPICPLKENQFEIPDLVRFCNQHKYSLNFVHVTQAYSHAMWALSSEALVELRDFYKKQFFECSDDNAIGNVNEFRDLTSRLSRWIDDACVKENLEKNLNLDRDKIHKLKKQLFENIESCLKKLYSDELELKDKKEKVYLKFDEVISSLPEHFDCNHFYEQMLKISPLNIVGVLLYHHSDSVIEIANEIFYYGATHTEKSIAKKSPAS